MTGTFTGAGTDLTTAPHLQGEPVRVTARFSNGGGDPGILDYAREGRDGGQVLPARRRQDRHRGADAALLLRAHFEDFLDFTRARKDPERLMPDWLGAHPEALTAIQAALGADPPASYATCAYNSIHSFRWIDADGESRFVRYRWEPEARADAVREDAKARGATTCSRTCSPAARARSG